MFTKHNFMRVPIFRLALVLLAILLIVMVISRSTQAEAVVETFDITTSVDNPYLGEYPETTTTVEERLEMQEKLFEIRELIDSQVDNNPESEYNLRPVREPIVPSTVFVDNVVESEFSEAPMAPGSFYLGANRRNTVAQSRSSTLAETAAAGDGRQVFYMGNTYASWSNNNGMTWTNVPIGAGTTGFSPCCDPDVIHDESRSVTYYIMLYLNVARTQGYVRVHVRPWIPSSNSCSYNIGFGTNVLPDYPHLGLSNNFLYMSVNNILNGSSWNGSQMVRWSLDEVGTCSAATRYTYQYGPSGVSQRVFVPAEGATEIMYWGSLNSTSQFRIFWWPESPNTVSTTLKSISTSTFANPDCRGGSGNYDWIERSTAWSITGFRLRGTVAHHNGQGELWFWWNAANDATYPRALIRSARFLESNKSLISQPHLWTSTKCLGFPAAATNARGHIGMSMGLGGQPGGGSTPAQGYVGLIDDYNWPFMGSIYQTAFGTHNRVDGRFGDYFTVRQHSSCEYAFNATNYSLLNGNWLSSHVNARYVQMMRERDSRCFNEWTWRSGLP